MALDQFILSLNEFFDLCEDLSEEMLMGNTEVSWYSYANVELSGNYIRAKSTVKAGYNELNVPAIFVRYRMSSLYKTYII